MIAELRGGGYEIVASGVVLGSGRPDFTLKQALSTHAAMHNAEGWLNREAVMHASRDLELRVSATIERDLHAQGAEAAGLTEAALRQRIAEVGVSIGPPWALDQKAAAVAAWIALAS